MFVITIEANNMDTRSILYMIEFQWYGIPYKHFGSGMVFSNRSLISIEFYILT